MLTNSGRKTVERVERVAREIRDETLADLSDQEIATAFRVLQHVCRILEDETGTPR